MRGTLSIGKNTDRIQNIVLIHTEMKKNVTIIRNAMRDIEKKNDSKLIVSAGY